MRNFLQGRKTYIGAGVLFVVALAGWWFGAINGTEATGMVALAFTAVGLGARSTRYAELTLAALQEIKTHHGDTEARRNLVKDVVGEVLQVAGAAQSTNITVPMGSGSLPQSISLHIPAEKPEPTLLATTGSAQK